jgi:hypothetical protein
MVRREPGPQVTEWYIWNWRWRNFFGARAAWFGDGVDRKGQRCRVLCRGSMNSALIEFEDGYRVVTSRGGLRKAREET